MAQFTDIFSFIKQETAENQLIWGSALASSFIDLVDEGLAGLVDIDVTAGDVTLTDTQGSSNQARNMIVRFSGSPVLGLTATVPNKSRLYAFDNQSGQVVTVKTTAATGITIEDGEIVSAVVDADTGFVFKMQLHGDDVILTGPANLSAISAFVFGSDPAGFTFNCYFFEEGDGIFNFGWEEFSFLNSASVSILVKPTTGTFPQSSRQFQTMPVWLDEGGTIFEGEYAGPGSTAFFIGHQNSTGITPSVQITVSDTLGYTRSNAPG